MNLTLHYANNPPFLPDTHRKRGLGGTENFSLYVAEHLKRAGHTVAFYNQAEIEPTDLDGLRWAHIEHFDPLAETDVLVSFRMREVFQTELAAKLKVLILADTESEGLGDDVRAGRIDVVMPVSQWQQDRIARQEDLVGHSCWMLASNGVDMDEFEGDGFESKQPGKCIFLSTPERGLSILLDLWPQIEDSEILAARGIEPELHLFSSFMGWGVSSEDNEAMCVDDYARVVWMVSEGRNITNHKHVPLKQMRQHQREADCLLYPSNFLETYCITLTECMAAGTIPVVSAKGALPERVRDAESGYLVGQADWDAREQAYQEAFVSKAITALWLPSARKARMRQVARDTARSHDYAMLVPRWAQAWQERLDA